MAEKVTWIKASRLVLDGDLWPRQDMQAYDKTSIVEALQAGTELPPIIVDKKTKKVVDGFHRTEAYRKLYGPDAKIPCIMRAYANESDMYVDAMTLNNSHGKKLTEHDKVRCLIRAEELGIDTETTARALNMTVESLGKLRTQRLGYFHTKPVVLKGTTSYLAGTELTAEQVSANREAAGRPATFYIQQVINLLEADALDMESEKVVKSLHRLHELLDKALSPVQV